MGWEEVRERWNPREWSLRRNEEKDKDGKWDWR